MTMTFTSKPITEPFQTLQDAQQWLTLFGWHDEHRGNWRKGTANDKIRDIRKQDKGYVIYEQAVS